MAKATQFSVGLDNRAGSVAKLCATLRRAGVNVQAISVADSADCSWVRLVASPTAAARTALKQAGYEARTQRVLFLKVSHRPGEIERIAAKLAAKGVNINYIYGSNADGPNSTLVLGVSNLDKAAKAVHG